MLPGAKRTNPGSPRIPLLLKPELLNDCVIAALVVLLEIAKMRTAISDHLKKTAARMKIFGVLLEVLGQFVDSAGKDSDLNVRRTGVRVVPGRIFDDGRLYAFGSMSVDCTTPCQKTQALYGVLATGPARDLGREVLKQRGQNEWLKI